ncbi:MAG: DNA replication protein [Rhodospirillales bacterium]|nr:DNA replication protein [Rhodospirillales bacterium]
MSQQFILNFEHRPALGGEDFLVAPCNGDAVAWIDRWPDWPSPALFLHGPAGCGKSHLAQVFLAKTQGVTITLEELMEKDPPTLLAGAGACLLDDLDQAFMEKDHGGLEIALLHLYNTVREAGTTMMMTGKTPPSRWPLQLADLSSRLKTASVAEIGSPDDALLAAVLVKQFADRQLKIDADVVAFVQLRIERSFGAIGRLVEAADRMALAEKRKITVPLVAQVLQELNKN